jgi:hypothetical protein
MRQAKAVAPELITVVKQAQPLTDMHKMGITLHIVIPATQLTFPSQGNI